MTSTSTATYTPPPLPPPFTNSPSHLLAQGAEGRLYKTTFLTPSTPAALKVRPAKPYRHPILDSRLTRQRILQEARCLVKLSRENVPVPGVLALDVECGFDGDGDGKSGEKREGEDTAGKGSSNWTAWLLMEWVDGIVVRQVVDCWEKWVKSKEKAGLSDHMEIRNSEDEICVLLRRIGLVVGAMHKAGIVHGDLTTSNLILRPVGHTSAHPLVEGKETEMEREGKETESTQPISTSITQDARLQFLEKPSLDGEIVLIDFGLAGQSIQDEDRAVDLYVLERAFGSSHPRTEPLFHEVLMGYADSYKGANVVLKKLEQVRLRGRKRSMIG
ncbi:serine/threonine-protein kinase bud32 [Paracoccidioides lutzii Pb01]|uniref:EKC/KEOPS complex subunit BUD32 n=1 Tax=Paracoccidioides lutzii (strain ATCC MYA-826 / Pb01) TaxID=502779 RepID=C1H518_PARBA|nr:serine/threonine-protein kinase bud32 [Paracoccidioides lutzii Pb01]EEH34812.2 serine/threonine-protein kinase bud32 [Paracoccidioides lutzii Pb01]